MTTPDVSQADVEALCIELSAEAASQVIGADIHSDEGDEPTSLECLKLAGLQRRAVEALRSLSLANAALRKERDDATFEMQERATTLAGHLDAMADLVAEIAALRDAYHTQTLQGLRWAGLTNAGELAKACDFLGAKCERLEANNVALREDNIALQAVYEQRAQAVVDALEERDALRARLAEREKLYGRGAYCLMEVMKAYERRIRTDCTNQEQIDKRPWECAEYRAGADFLRATRPIDAALAAQEGEKP